jgi:hypothetical protein
MEVLNCVFLSRTHDGTQEACSYHTVIGSCTQKSELGAENLQADCEMKLNQWDGYETFSYIN